MNKKTVTLGLAAGLAATTLIGGTMAYFTDTAQATNTFTYGKVKIELIETDENGDPFEDGKVLIPGTRYVNNVAKNVTVKNIGENDAYMWIEVLIPAALDDGDDHSPQACGLGNSLHFNYPLGMTETKWSYLETETVDNVVYNKYVHYYAGQTEGIAKGEETDLLLKQVYMDKDVTQCTDESCENYGSCHVLMDGETHYAGPWNLIIRAVGFQSEGIAKIEDAIELWYDNDKDLADYIWS